MRTLVYCTAYADTPSAWQTRYRRWVEALRRSGVRFDQLLLVDDGSAALPDWGDAAVVTEAEAPRPQDVVSAAPLLIYHFESRLGRASLFDFPGWYRSFAFGAAYARAQGFEKVIHLESDAFLISSRMRRYVDRAASGWTIFWTEKYGFPEIAIQVIGPDQIDALAAFCAEPYERMRGEIHEHHFHPTHLEKGMFGDRYGETAEPIPRTADYATQVPSQREPSYYWWLTEEAGDAVPGGHPSGPGGDAPGEATAGSAPLTLEFGAEGNAAEHVVSGWSYPESGLRWMVDEESVLRLPVLRPDSRSVVTLTVMPHVAGDRLPFQTLVALANDLEVARFDVRHTGTVGFEVPAGVWGEGVNTLRLRHPDAAAPADVQGGGDHRRLSLAVLALTLRQPGGR